MLISNGDYQRSLTEKGVHLKVFKRLICFVCSFDCSVIVSVAIAHSEKIRKSIEEETKK